MFKSLIFFFSSGGEDYEQIMEIVTTMDFVFGPEAVIPYGRRKRSSPPPVQQCTNVSIIADDIVEYDEYFRLYLSTEDPAVVLMPANATVVILNNDCESELRGLK